jgi:putative endonuclease
MPYSPEILPEEDFAGGQDLMPWRSSDTGREGERIAEHYLRARGYTIVALNYRWERAEVDIIARDGEILVFCEVKMRTDDQYGPPELAVTRRKQGRVRQAALGYCAENEIENQVCRFDVVAIQCDRGRLELRHIEDAF